MKKLKQLIAKNLIVKREFFKNRTCSKNLIYSH